MKVLPHVMRNINEFNIPPGNSHGYEILYFGVNLILMIDYSLSFDLVPRESSSGIEVLILSRKDVGKWKNDNDRSGINPYYSNGGTRINDVFRPAVSDSYAFIIINKSPWKAIAIEVTLTHSWQQRIKESQIKDEQQANKV
jgi:hypothetical protein